MTGSAALDDNACTYSGAGHFTIVNCVRGKWAPLEVKLGVRDIDSIAENLKTIVQDIDTSKNCWQTR